MASDKPFRIGVLFAGITQLLDVVPIDLLAMLDKDYLKDALYLPQAIYDQGLKPEVFYIASKGPSVECTANASLKITHTFGDPEVAPGTLDIVLIPGPDPMSIPSDEIKTWLRGHAANKDTVILTVCTGVFVAAHAGILDGKKPTGPRGALPILKTTFPNAEWVDKRWAVNGNIWTSAGMSNGLDMVAAFIKDRWPGLLSEAICTIAGVGYRGQEYQSPNESLMDQPNI